MIIVEGMDNAGKTTLVDRLSEDLKLLRISNRKRPTGLTDMYWYAISMVELSKQYPTIFDRWQIISEPIYGPICRGTDWPSQADLYALEAMTTAVNPLIIYCRPPDEVILNFGDRPQMEGVIDQAKQLIAAYDRAIERLEKSGWFGVLRYDYKTDTYEVLRKQVLDFFEKVD